MLDIAGGGLQNAFASTQMQQTDYQNAMTIAVQMQAEAQKQQMNRWRILQDTQTETFKIRQEVTINQAKVQDKIFNKWDEYIRG